MTEQACPGGCNYHWRKADEAYRQALADYDPLDPAQSRPEPPELKPVQGNPWCPRCQAVIRRELADLDYATALLAAMADGQRGRRPGAKMPQRKQHGTPSPSPTGDLLEEFASELRRWEQYVRGGPPAARRGYLATEISAMIAWLVLNADRALIMPGAEDFGAWVRWWHKRLRGIAKAGTGVQHRPIRCPRCEEYAIWWTEGDDHAECRGKGGTCRRLFSMDELDDLAAEQEAARALAAGGKPTRPAA